MAIPDTAVVDYELPSTTEVPPPPTPTTATTTGTASQSPPSTWAQSQLVSSYLTQPVRAQVEFPNPTLAPYREFGPRLLPGLGTSPERPSTQDLWRVDDDVEPELPCVVDVLTGATAVGSKQVSGIADGGARVVVAEVHQSADPIVLEASETSLAPTGSLRVVRSPTQVRSLVPPL